MDQARHEPLEQLPLPEHDHGLVLDALRHVVEALDRLAEPHEVDEQLSRAAQNSVPLTASAAASASAPSATLYGDCAFLSSAVIAGTTSARSPITA